MDPNGPYEGRAKMREVSRDEFEAYRRAMPDREWNISTPVGMAGPERYFIQDNLREDIEAIEYELTRSSQIDVTRLVGAMLRLLDRIEKLESQQ